jgi:hypothetical protein
VSGWCGQVTPCRPLPSSGDVLFAQNVQLSNANVRAAIDEALTAAQMTAKGAVSRLGAVCSACPSPRDDW